LTVSCEKGENREGEEKKRPWKICHPVAPRKKRRTPLRLLQWNFRDEERVLPQKKKKKGRNRKSTIPEEKKSLNQKIKISFR